MRRTVLAALLAVTASVAALAAKPGKFAATDSCLADGGAWNYRVGRCDVPVFGPVDRLFLDKSDHWLAAYRNGQIVREFRVALGRGGLKPKTRAGDGRVPEGVYTIDAHNPASGYHLSLHISYPTPQQAAEAAAQGVTPGGDIMIHGLPNGRGAIGSRQRSVDWTDGCIALTNAEMDWLYSAVADGTPIEIHA